MTCTILVVDDSATMRAIIKSFVAKLGCTVLEAANADEALALAASRPVNLLISDVWLGGMSGLELVTTLRRPPFFRPSAVMLVSSDGSEELAKKVRSLGVDEFLQKPFAPSHLTGSLRHLLDKVGVSH